MMGTHTINPICSTHIYLTPYFIFYRNEWFDQVSSSSSPVSHQIIPEFGHSLAPSRVRILHSIHFGDEGLKLGDSLDPAPNLILVLVDLGFDGRDIFDDLFGLICHHF